jgi:hypothetical protein
MPAKLKKIILLPVFAGLLLIIFSASAAAVDILGPACQQAPGSPICKQAAQQGTVNPVTHTINVASNIVAAAAGIAAVVMIIISGLTLITSSGNTERVATARRRLLYSIIGLVIIALAWTITRFITSRVIQ